MPCCCVNTLNLCNVSVCGNLEIEKAAVIGSGETDYSLVLDYLGSQITLTQEQSDGENIKFDISMLNENFEFTGKIYDTEGEVVEFEIDGETYDCVKFRTVLNISI